MKAILKAFESPQYYRNLILNNNIAPDIIKHFNGKSFICISLTKFCPVGCPFCFFKSRNYFGTTKINDEINADGIDKFIKFANNINLGYLLVSGGGEPMLKKSAIIKIVSEVVSERIILVTSAYWAKSYSGAEEYVNKIANAIAQRKQPTSVTIRVSIDCDHMKFVKYDSILNLIKLFYNKYRDNRFIELQLHSIIGDNSISKLSKLLKNDFIIKRKKIHKKRISDGNSVLKIVPHKEILYIDDYEISIGYANLFYSDLKIDLKSSCYLQRNIYTYQKDLYESEDGNSSIVANVSGEYGLDFGLIIIVTLRHVVISYWITCLIYILTI